MEGQGQNAPDEAKDSVHGDSENAEGQEEQPDDGVGDQGDERQRPAHDEENAPEEESEHIGLSFLEYVGWGREVRMSFLGWAA